MIHDIVPIHAKYPIVFDDEIELLLHAMECGGSLGNVFDILADRTAMGEVSPDTVGDFARLNGWPVPEWAI